MKRIFNLFGFFFLVLAVFSKHKELGGEGAGMEGVEKSTEKGILVFPFTPRTELTVRKG